MRNVQQLVKYILPLPVRNALQLQKQSKLHPARKTVRILMSIAELKFA